MQHFISFSILFLMLQASIYADLTESYRKAFEDKDLKRLETLIKKRPQSESLDALLFAVQSKNEEAVNLFFNSEIKVDKKKLNSLLCVACSKTGNEEIIELLIEKGADVNAYNEDGMPALMLACTSRTDDTKPVEILIKHGADINAVNKITKQNALFYAVQNNNYSIAEYLLAQGINADDLNRTNALGNTMLHVAVQFNKYKLTEDLIKRGADINKKNASNNTPLYIAVMNQNQEFIRLLLQNGAKVDDSIILEARKQSLELFQLLLDACIESELTAKEWENIFLMLVQENRVDLVKLLLRKAKLNINAVDEQNLSSLYYAVCNNNEELAKLLLEHKANANFVDAQNNFLLFYAVRNNQEGLVQLLLEHGAKADETILFEAEQKNNDKILQLLRHQEPSSKEDLGSRTNSKSNIPFESKNWKKITPKNNWGDEIGYYFEQDSTGDGQIYGGAYYLTDAALFYYPKDDLLTFKEWRFEFKGLLSQKPVPHPGNGYHKSLKVSYRVYTADGKKSLKAKHIVY